jgi:putative multiple sugar transport system permease protein
MTTDTAPQAASPAEAGAQQRLSIWGALQANLREYGLLLVLILIMLFFQWTTGGVLFKPLNLTNIVLQNSYIIVMALGMLLVIVCLIVGAAIGAAQGYLIAYYRIPSFIVTLAGMLIFKGLSLSILAGQSVGPFPAEFQLLSAGFIPDFVGPITLIPAGDGVQQLVLHGATLAIGIVAVVAMVLFSIRGRARRTSRGYESEPFALFAAKNIVIAALVLFFTYMLASYKGLPNVLVVMGLLIAGFVFLTKRLTFGRRIYAIGGNPKAAALSGIKTERLTFYIFAIMGALAALAGMIYAARLNSATPKAGQGLELDVIAAVFIGGASALGGVGQVAGAVIGAFIMGVLNNGMSIMGINIDLQQMIKGVVLLAAVFFDLYNKNKA